MFIKDDGFLAGVAGSLLFRGHAKGISLGVGNVGQGRVGKKSENLSLDCSNLLLFE